MKKSLSKFSLAANLLTIWLCSFFRHRWFQTRKDTACKKLGSALHATVTIASLRISITGRITVKGLQISKGKLQTEITLLRLAVNKRSALRGRFRLSACHIEKWQTSVTYLAPPAAKKEEKKDADATPGNNTQIKFPHGIYRTVFRLFHTCMEYMPDKLDITTANISISRAGKNIHLYLSELQLANQAYQLKISGTANAQHSCTLKGKWITADRRITLEECSMTDQGGTYFSSNELLMELSGKTPASLNFQLMLKDALVRWKILSLEDVHLSLLELNIDVQLTKTAFEIAETSYLQYNNVFINFYVTHNFQEDDVCQASLHMDSLSMDEFLQSFPSFSYRKLYEAAFKGNIPAFDIVLAFRLDNPFNHIFEINPEENDAALTLAPGVLPDLEQPFKHDVYDNGRYIKSIHLSESNEGFVNIDSLPSILISIIINTEDPNFEFHNGVDPISVGFAIIRNILHKKFVTGASTITMQLARNLFLRHHKNIYRKIEEIVIAILLENICGLSKKRILEIYFNIIEFAPGVYGIKDAAQYYFMKSPSSLTPQECLVLTYIIPRPKYFIEAFLASSEQLKRNLHNHIRIYTSTLVERTLMSPEEAAEINYLVRIQDHELSLV